MKKIEEVNDIFFKLDQECELLESLSFVLWGSLVNNDFSGDDPHNMTASFLNERIADFKKDFQKGYTLFLESLKEMKA